MEYSIHELARLSGVTTRTLRWYDRVGLLKPSRVAESGYRYYGPAEVDRLQSILFYRALGVELAQIRACLDAPDYDRLAALRGHLTALEQEQARLTRLIASVRETILTEERNETMDDEKKFAAFKAETVRANEQAYGEEARRSYGDGEVDAANARLLNLSEPQYREWKALGDEIIARLGAAVQTGTSPEGETGREIAALHRRWLTLVGPDYSPEKHRGIAELYVLDARFAAHYDASVPGCARFLRDAVRCWIH